MDGLTLIVVGRFASHMTGTTSMLVHDLARGRLAVGMAALGALFAFASGASVAGLLVGDRTSDRQVERLPLLLVIEAVSLIGAGVVGDGGSNDVAVMLALSAFAMGVQNASSSLCLGDRVRTTHLTGTLTDLGIAVGRLVRVGRMGPHHPPIAEMLRRSSSRLAAFAIGGLLAGMVAPAVGRLGLLAPSAVLFACALGRLPTHRR